MNSQYCLFKPLKLVKPNQHINDIFCLRAQRTVNPYRKISLDGIEIVVPGGKPRQAVDLKLIPGIENNIIEMRFWQGNKFLGNQNLPLQDFRTIVRF